jgi:hypothetical protein
MPDLGNIFCGGQFQVSANLPAGVPGVPATALGGGAGTPPINGSGWIEGPFLVGSPLTYPSPRPLATLMIGRSKNYLAPETSALPILMVSSRASAPTPTDLLIGDPSGPVGLTATLSPSATVTVIGKTTYSAVKTTAKGILSWTGPKFVVTAKTVFNKKSTTNGKKTINGKTTINGYLTVNGGCKINGFLKFTGSIVGVTKKFDIPHPTKENHRLAHSCIEGPENGVYHRGRLTNSNVINLPDYWRGLVDLETITVTLTPHCSYQELYVKSIEWGTKINVLNNSGGLIDCSYTVFAKRKDIADLVVEYEGNEPKDWSTVGK